MDLVLVTDLSKQAAFLKDFATRRETPEAVEKRLELLKLGTVDTVNKSKKPLWDLVFDGSSDKARHDRMTFLKLLIKAADVSNPAKATPLYLFWTNRIMEEFYNQGDEEKRLGLPVVVYEVKYSLRDYRGNSLCGRSEMNYRLVLSLFIGSSFLLLLVVQLVGVLATAYILLYLLTRELTPLFVLMAFEP